MNPNASDPSVSPAAPHAGDDGNETWGVVLAAGEGARLARVTHLLCGRETPKQFVAFSGDKTLLQQTVERMRRFVPYERMVVVVAVDWRRMADEQLRPYPGVEVVSQPRNVGTGPGTMLPIAHIRARCPWATIVMTPSDHDIPRVESFETAVQCALGISDQVPAGLTLVGAEADQPVTDLGWIVPEFPAGQASETLAGRVTSFVEKPTAAVAKTLMEKGGLWNTLIVVGHIDAFWRHAEMHMKTQFERFRRYLLALQIGASKDQTGALLEHLYLDMPVADFSRAILEKADGLGVVRMRDSGWSDCGTPARLLESLLRVGGSRPGLRDAIRVCRRAQDEAAAMS